MKAPLSPREIHSLKIREALVSACGDLMAKQTIDAITINNIVQHAGVAKGSFYNHFLDKEELAATVSGAILHDVEAAVHSCNENVTDPAYKMVRGMCTHIQLAVADPRQATIMLRGHDWLSSNGFHLHQSIRADVSEGIASGRFASRCDDVGIIQIIGTGYFTMIRIIEQKLSVAQAIDLATRALTLTLCGFGLAEDEARIIVAGSAKDIIRG